MADSKRIILVDIEIQTDKLLKSVTDARKEVEKLKAENKNLVNELKNAGEIGSASWNKANRALVENEANLRKAQQVLKDTQKEYDNVGKAQEQQAQKQAQAQQEKIQADELATQSTKELTLAMQTMSDTIDEALGGSPEQQELIQNITNTKVALAELNQVNNTLKEGLKGVAVGTPEFKRITQAIAENEAQTRQAKGELNNYQKQLDTIGKANTANVGSYEQLLRQYNQAEVRLKTLGNTLKINKDGTVELTAEYKKAQAQVLNLKEGLLKFNEGIKDGRLNVGNYTQSFQQAIQNTGLFGQAIAQVQNTIQSGQAIYEGVQSGLKLVQDGYNTVGESINTFISSFTSAGTTAQNATTTINQSAEGIRNVAENANEASVEVEAVGGSGERAGRGLLGGFNLATNGTKLLKAGLASIGIGLIISAVVALIGYFTKFQSGIDKLKQALAGVTGFFESIISGVVAIGKAIATLDFTSAGEGIANLGSNAVDSAKKLAQLEARKQSLEQQDINNISIQGELKREIEDLILLSEDKTKSDQERISAIEEAGQTEVRLLQNQLAREQELLDITNAEIELKKKKGTATRDDLRLQAEVTEKVLNLQDDILDKEIEVNARASKLRKSLAQDTINANIGLLQNQLKLAELGGQNTVKLAKDIALQEKNAKLEQTNLSDAERKLAESNYQVAIAQIEADAREKRRSQAEQYNAQQKALAEATADALLNTIVDGKTRELAIEAEGLQRKLAEIKGNGEKEKALREALINESATKVLEIERNYAQKSLDEQNATLQKNLEQQVTQIEKNIKAKQNALELEKSQGLISEEDYTKKLLELEIEKQDQILVKQQEYAVSRLANEDVYFQDAEAKAREQFESKKITDQQYQDQLAEINTQRKDTQIATEEETQALLTETTEAGNQARLQATVNANNEILKNSEQTAQAQKQFNQQFLDSTKQALSAFSQLLQGSEKDRRKNANAIKAIASAEVLINAYQEISGYWTGAGKDASKSGIYGGIGATILATILTASALARATTNLSAINAQKFAKGGYTVANALAEYSPTVSNDFGGGYVSSPTMWQGNDGGMKLAGEAGTEWVSPAWQIRQAPSLFASLERWRKTGVRTFADGGFTTSNISAPILNTVEIFEGAISRGFANAPAPVVSVTEINEIQTRVSVIENRSSL